MKKTLLLLLLTLSFTFFSQAQILKKPIPDKLVVLTFDDAPASQYSVVAPLLKKYGFGATFFVCEFQPNYADSALYMNWRQIQELNQMGFEIANHTHTHANVSKLSQAEFNAELSYIEAKCDSLGISSPTNFAYPGYGLNAKALEFLEQKDYVFARAGGSRAYDPLSDHPYLIPSWATDEKNKVEIMKAFEQAKNGKIVILTIHGVPDIEHPWVNTPPELFEEYLELLKKGGFTVISMKELEKYVASKAAKKIIKADFNKRSKN
ncbi:Peptidoglycan/xylan/chitin deacetylase, PgdA/CDA1 family [Algoriphagus locisalis]|uniref:Peptidoglycan/xylan/chitin deacetylase, PgdA/CDA1 family n=1 Tax=Algoriphagus locisalis TaxID=305507 RepID=A0A1I7E2E6_9BACT|nr:polysaccharide deacetylase family protein [Algoriphagus locisalis]SFU18121.1 Peptidoglycan/xylan/chitin deacetylase, PgdA/CDA1 family [Algoriphagus locisalis]